MPFRLHPSSRNTPSGYDGPYAAWADDEGGLIVAVGVGEGGGASLELAHVDGSGHPIYGPAVVDRIDSLPSTWSSELLYQVWRPLSAAVDGDGRTFVLWSGSARCAGEATERAGDGVMFGRWLDPQGLPLGDTFSIPIGDRDVFYVLHALPDGVIALGAFRRDGTFAWSGELRGGAAEIAPARPWLASTPRAALVNTPAGVAVLTEPCQAPDGHGSIDVTAPDGSTHARIVLPDSTTCADPLKAVRFTVGNDGTIAEITPALDAAPFTCTFALWHRALQ